MKFCIRIITIMDDYQFIKPLDEVLVALLSKADDMLRCNDHTMELVMPPNRRDQVTMSFSTTPTETMDWFVAQSIGHGRTHA